MKLLLVASASGNRLGDEAYAEFAKRFPPEMRLELKAVKAEPRGAKTAEQLMAAEAARIEAALRRRARVVLDERGERVTTLQLAARMKTWLHDGAMSRC